MSYLIAQGQQPQQRWRRRLPEGVGVMLGRDCGLLSASWDSQISRSHALLSFADGRLQVTRHSAAKNPIYVRGREVDTVTILPGEHFVIGNTSFALSQANARVSPETPWPVTEMTFSAESLHGHRFRDADKRIELLGRLPEVLSGSNNDTEVGVRIVNLLLDGIQAARAAAIVELRSDTPSEDDDTVGARVIHWDRRAMDHSEFAPSGRLIRQALEQQESVVHVWEPSLAASEYTQGGNLSWAFCVPLSGTASQNWALYVAGGMAGPQAIAEPDQLQDELKFAELVATTLANLRESRRLERNQSSLRQFFSPVVLDALSWQDPEEVLAPQEANVSVLFCDLRGFSRRSEQSADNLLGLLNRVSNALGVMTHHILDQGGVVGDFQGDAAMGFWGWPLPQDDAAERACRAALAIRRAFEQAAGTDEHSLQDFRVGIGVATGRAVAGKIGTVDHVKVTVFGPVVNLASRLEGMTKLLRAPILLDEETTTYLRSHVPDTVARTRRVARVRPYQLDTDLEVSELLPPESEYGLLQAEHIKAYESSLDHLESGDWERAFQLLHQVPAEDRVKDFLTVLIAQHNRSAPEGWDGVIKIESK